MRMEAGGVEGTEGGSGMGLEPSLGANCCKSSETLLNRESNWRKDGGNQPGSPWGCLQMVPKGSPGHTGGTR